METGFDTLLDRVCFAVLLCARGDRIVWWCPFFASGLLYCMSCLYLCFFTVGVLRVIFLYFLCAFAKADFVCWDNQILLFHCSRKYLVVLLFEIK